MWFKGFTGKGGGRFRDDLQVVAAASSRGKALEWRTGIPERALARGALTFGASGISACSAGSKTPSSPSPTPQSNSTINYTAIAASDGIGLNSSVPCLPFAGVADCPGGTGYVYVAARQLQAKSFTVALTN